MRERLPDGQPLDRMEHDRVGCVDRGGAQSQTLWWEGSFEARERFMWTAEELDGFLEGIAGALGPSSAQRLRRIVARLRG